MKYDVFISSKSEDYHLSKIVYDFLTKNGLSAFLASEELQKIGEAQYAKAIDNALDESVHMVVVASSLSNINSKWVQYEWSTFSNDLKSGYRDGNLLTILSGSIELKSLPASLRHQQSFHFDNYKKEILDYLKVLPKEDVLLLEYEESSPISFAKNRKRIRGHILICSIILLLLFSFVFFTPKLVAIKKAKEALEYCDDDRGSYQCFDALNKALDEMKRAGVAKKNHIREEVENRINNNDLDIILSEIPSSTAFINLDECNECKELDAECEIILGIKKKLDVSLISLKKLWANYNNNVDSFSDKTVFTQQIIQMSSLVMSVQNATTEYKSHVEFIQNFMSSILESVYENAKKAMTSGDPTLSEVSTELTNYAIAQNSFSGVLTKILSFVSNSDLESAAKELQGEDVYNYYLSTAKMLKSLYVFEESRAISVKKTCDSYSL